VFEAQIAQKAQYDQQLVEFVKLYAKFREDAQKCADNPVVSADYRIRMARFAARVDAEWLKVPEDKRECLARALLAKELIPKEVEAALRIFQAKVIRVN
jgi:hypothetical protein